MRRDGLPQLGHVKVLPVLVSAAMMLVLGLGALTDVGITMTNAGVVVGPR